MFRLFSTILICILCTHPRFSFAATTAIGAEREIVVVATVHEATDAFNEKTLIGILSRVNPDLVLLELDPSFFDGAAGRLPDRFLNLTLETRAVAAYAKAAQINERPYDIDGRNRFFEQNNYFDREAAFNREIARLSAANQLAGEAKALFDALTGFAAVRDACGTSGPDVMNSAVCDAAIERKQEYGFKGLLKIVELTPALSSFKPFAVLADDFWTRRNEAMVTNIIKIANQLQPARVVVLCGYEHRYYLRKSLKNFSEKEHFVVKEYWEHRATVRVPDSERYLRN